MSVHQLFSDELPDEEVVGQLGSHLLFLEPVDWDKLEPLDSQ